MASNPEDRDLISMPLGGRPIFDPRWTRSRDGCANTALPVHLVLFSGSQGDLSTLITACWVAFVSQSETCLHMQNREPSDKRI